MCSCLCANSYNVNLCDLAHNSILCVKSDNVRLCDLAHNPILCVKPDIDVLCDLAHNRVKGKESIMSELARSPEQIGNAIRRARKKCGMSQSELGEKAGLRQETISLIENGNPAAKLETILAVLSALGLGFQIHPRMSKMVMAAQGLLSGDRKMIDAAKGLGVDEPE